MPTVFAACLGAAGWFGFDSSPSTAAVGRETRTLSLYQVNTKESLTVTYKVNGRYIPSALRKINYLMRDWRRNEVIAIDPKTIDLMWELHADLGSTRPINIICGYRSPKTNSFLKRIGRNVARKSQHMIGKAIDISFPDIPIAKLRSSAMVRQVGGVGYYPTSGASGFVHIDSGNVRYWPRPSASQMAKIMRDGRRTVGARLSRRDQIMVASVKAQESADAAEYEGAGEDEADAPKSKAEEAGVKAPMPRAKPAAQPPVELVMAYPVPLPRPKPIEVLMMAAANMKIEPASAPAPRINFISKPSPVEDSLGVVAGGESMVEEPDHSQTASNTAAKGSFADSLRDGTAEGTPLIKPLTASADLEDSFWWPKRLVFSPDQAVRRDGAPQEFVGEEPAHEAAQAAPERASPMTMMIAQANAAPVVIGTAVGTKGDLLEVNRSSKGSLLMRLPAYTSNADLN